jgi:hypothetical protein
MSKRVLVIPEDPTLDQYVLQPVIAAACRHIGFEQARVRVLTDPAFKGVSQALDPELLQEVVERYPMVDLFLLCVDRDGLAGRDESVAEKCERMDAYLKPGQTFAGRTAEQELEVWCVAASLPKGWRMADVRAEPHSKERFFEPLVSSLKLDDSPGAGREILGRKAAKKYSSIRKRCVELQDIEGLIASGLA